MGDGLREQWTGRWKEGKEEEDSKWVGKGGDKSDEAEDSNKLKTQ